MFRDTGAGDGAEKKGQDKEKMQDDVLTKEQLAARQPRRAEGDPAHGEPQLDFDRQDQAVQFKPRRASKPTRRACVFDRFRQSHFDRPLFDAGRKLSKICLPASHLITAAMMRMRSVFMNIFPNFGLCPPRLFSPMAALTVVCQFPAF